MRAFVFVVLPLIAAGAFRDGCTIDPLPLAHLEQHVSGKRSDVLDFYYHKGLPYNALNSFTDVFLRVNLTDPNQYTFYQGDNCSIVQGYHENDNRYFGILKKAAFLRTHQLSPFNDTIVGISTSEPYSVSVQVWEVNFIRLAVFVGAIVLFLFASALVRNTLFYYTSGCSLGVIASLLLVIFVIYRFAPKKLIGLPILVGGWSVSLYMLHFAWANFSKIMLQYQKFVIAYFATTLLISLAVCYKRGPPTDARSHDIAQWALQLLAISLIYFSCQVPEVSLVVIGILVVQQISRGWLGAIAKWYLVGLRTFWGKMFPKPRRLLTEEEFREQAQETTRQELARLREFCSSPENRPWQIAGNVRSANRLARFVANGTPHVTDDETYEHELNGDQLHRYDFGEDVDDEDEQEHEEWDEIVILEDAGRPDSAQAVRVPRSVSSLLTNYRLNQSLPLTTTTASPRRGAGGHVTQSVARSTRPAVGSATSSARRPAAPLANRARSRADFGASISPVRSRVGIPNVRGTMAGFASRLHGSRHEHDDDDDDDVRARSRGLHLRRRSSQRGSGSFRVNLR